MLRCLKRVSVRLCPGDASCGAAKELLARLGCDRARRAHPGCTLDVTLVEQGKDGGVCVRARRCGDDVSIVMGPHRLDHSHFDN